MQEAACGAAATLLEEGEPERHMAPYMAAILQTLATALQVGRPGLRGAAIVLDAPPAARPEPAAARAHGLNMPGVPAAAAVGLCIHAGPCIGGDVIGGLWCVRAHC